MAYEYLNALKEILQQGGVSDCDMEKGMVRCDVNVSVRPVGTKQLGAKIEIKNMNSFSGVRRALEYEIPRQIEAVKRGEKLIQSTRRWDDVAGITEQMRTKEDAHDYRYFPDPDLMPIAPTDEWIAAVKSRVVELPLAYKQRVVRELGLPPQDAEVFKSNVRLRETFEQELKWIPASVQGEQRAKHVRGIANWVINVLPAKIEEAKERKQKTSEAASVFSNEIESLTEKEFELQKGAIAMLFGLVDAKTISHSAAQQVFAEMYDTGKSPATIVQEKGLAQVSDITAIEKFCDEAIAANPNPVADFKAGKLAALNSLKGQVMKLSKGKANPALVGEVLERKLKA